MLRFRHLILATLIVCFSISGPAHAKGLLDLFMSPSDEAEIGAEQHPKILEEFGGRYDDLGLSDYVESIGQFLVQTSETPNASFTFTILNSPLVNAFALPGGYVYVTRGILSLASNEAELAGVIAHEIGHVTARHSASRAGNNVLANIGLGVLGVVTGDRVLTQIGQLGAAAVLQSHSRGDEFEADQAGVRYLTRAGFIADAMSSFLAKLEAHSHLETEIKGVPSDKGFDFLATHPRTADRVKRAIQLAKNQSTKNPIVGEDLYLRKINGMVFGDDPSQGIVRGGRFIHPLLRFEFVVPDGFSILNGKSSVIAQGLDDAAIQFDFANRTYKSLEKYIRRDWAQGEVLSQMEVLDINSMPAATAVIHPRNGPPDRILRLVAIGFDARTVYRFLFSTPSRMSREIRQMVEHTALTFRRLNEAEARDAKPIRIVLHRVVAGDTPENLAERMAMGEFKIERFRVLNGLSSNETLKIGTFVKLVR